MNTTLTVPPRPRITRVGIRPRRPLSALGSTGETVLRHVGAEPVTAQEIASGAALTVPQVRRALGDLRELGLVVCERQGQVNAWRRR